MLFLSHVAARIASAAARSEAIRLLSLDHKYLDLREIEDSLSPFVIVCRSTQIAAELIGLSINLLLGIFLFMTKYYCNFTYSFNGLYS